MNITAEIDNNVLIMVADLCLEITNEVLNQLVMPSSNRFAAASFDVKLRRGQNYNMGGALPYVEFNIHKLTLDEKGIYDQKMQSVNNGIGEIKSSLMHREELVKCY